MLMVVINTSLHAQWSNGLPTGSIYYGGWVGAGTNNPSSVLHVEGPTPRQHLRVSLTGATPYLSIWQGSGGAGIDPIGTQKLYLGYDNPIDVYVGRLGGKMGLGTEAPTSQLHLASNSDHAFTISRSNGSYGFRIFRNATEGAVYFQIANTASTWESKIMMGEGEGTNSALRLVPDNGNVLIGKTTQINAAYKLDVNGSVRANEVVVNTTGADFVFDPNYKLPSIGQVKDFIARHKHLPEIESADEMQKNGVEVGKLNIKLLQKIEEMTLYMIELKDEVAKIKSEKEQLEARVAEIEKK